ncbi:MAG: UDP-glucose 4-epimerase GalE [Rhodobiaceae bacterium]|nr:UDP-glucose 4-epimerase GalE [Rhodobiaceae bacterium]MCC0013178.1 UDP-glucose 4-epimerase GalE [Rhodobiaceae bacterium]
MSVLVTGGAGYIGSHMVLALADRGENVVVIDNLSTGVRANVDKRAALVIGDAGDQDLVGKLVAAHDVDAIVHFAGSIVVPDSVTDPLGYYLNNTVKSRALIAAAIDAGVKNFIFSSTAAVYGSPEVNPIGEDAVLAPISPYGTSKMMTEMMLRDAAAAHPFQYVALRYFNVAGADPKGRSGQSTPRATHLIKVASQAALAQRNHLDVFGTDYETPDGTCIRDYIHVSDLIGAHILALDHLRQQGGSLTMNCGYGTGYSVMEVIEAVKRIGGTDFPVRFTDRRAGDPPILVAGAQRIREELGWEPQFADLDRIVTDAMSWERKLVSGLSAA